MLDLSVEGVTTYVERRWGPIAANATGTLIVITLVVGLLALLSTSAVALYGYVQKALGAVSALAPTLVPTGVQAQSAAVAFGVTVAVTLGFTLGFSAMLTRAWVRHRRAISKSVEAYVAEEARAIKERCERLEQQVASLTSINTVFDDIYRRLPTPESAGRREALTAQLNQPRALPVGGALTIHSACYGAESHWFDVTELLRAEVRPKGLEIMVSNETFGHDPIKGTHKKLEIVYSIGSSVERLTAEQTEGARLRIIVPPDVSAS